MNYELAKQLKDAGFPQSMMVQNGCLDYSFPTLSELIEACGDDTEYGKVTMYFSLTYWPANKLWYAEQKSHKGIDDSPEEAVAKLWLELNKQHD